MKVFSIRKWGLITVDSKRCRPKIKKGVDVAGRHLVTPEEKVGKFELEAIIIWLPLAVVRLQIRIRRRCVRLYSIVSVLITDLSYKQ